MFKGLWCGCYPNPVYQHITDKVFNHLLKVNCPIKSTAEATQSQLLDYNEKNALRYVAGYVTRKIYRKLKNSKNLMKDELLLCLAEINDVDPNEMLDESNDWLKEIDRGGLKHVTNMAGAYLGGCSGCSSTPLSLKPSIN